MHALKNLIRVIPSPRLPASPTMTLNTNHYKETRLNHNSIIGRIFCSDNTNVVDFNCPALDTHSIGTIILRHFLKALVTTAPSTNNMPSDFYMYAFYRNTNGPLKY